MTYTKKQFLEDVAKEAKALRKHATKEELAKLDFKRLDPHSSYSCIYGQMTGNCVSERANDLISKCAKKLIDFKEYAGWDISDAIETAVDKKPTKIFLSRHRKENILNFISSIEAFIMLNDDSKNENLIAYLKGETNDLKL